MKSMMHWNLLQQQILFLSKMNFLNQEFWECGDFEDEAQLENFFLQRTTLLEILKRIEERLENQGNPSESVERGANSMAIPKREIQLRSELMALTQKIVKQDELILSKLENLRSNISMALNDTRRNRKRVSAYKSDVGARQIDKQA